MLLLVHKLEVGGARRAAPTGIYTQKRLLWHAVLASGGEVMELSCMENGRIYKANENGFCNAIKKGAVLIEQAGDTWAVYDVPKNPTLTKEDSENE